MIMLVWAAVIAGCVGLDQLTKVLIVRSYELGESHEIIKGVIDFTHVQNKGAAWGMLSDNRWVFIAISAVLIVVLPIILYKYRRVHALFGISMSFIIGGAIGNMIDRIFCGYVTDFIEFSFVNFPVFNVADCFVTVGAVMMFIYLVFIDKTIFKSNKKKDEGSADALPDGSFGEEEQDDTDGQK